MVKQMAPPPFSKSYCLYGVSCVCFISALRTPASSHLPKTCWESGLAMLNSS